MAHNLTLNLKLRGGEKNYLPFFLPPFSFVNSADLPGTGGCAKSESGKRQIGLLPLGARLQRDGKGQNYRKKLVRHRVL
jgi:hypothetical protein